MSSSTKGYSRPILHVLIPIVVSLGIIAITAFVWVQHIRYLVDNAGVSENPDYWIQIARVKAYDACYEGCHDCLDVEFADKACRLTTKVDVIGVVCDANRMWNWAERHPTECLVAVGDVYKANAIQHLKDKYWTRLWWLILTVPAGIVGYLAAAAFLKCLTAKWDTDIQYELITQRQPSLRRPRPKRKGSRTALLGSATIASIAGTANAFPCTMFNPAVTHFFANPDNSLYGVVHGWLSDCYIYTYACGETCPSNSNRCTTIYCEDIAISASPTDFVVTASRRVVSWRFKMVDSVPGVIDARIGNPHIERDLWVKVSVNRFNLTDHTEPSIMCLYDIVK